MYLVAQGVMALKMEKEDASNPKFFFGHYGILDFDVPQEELDPIVLYQPTHLIVA